MPAKTLARKTKQVIGSRTKITLDDARGKETLTLQTATGQTITLSTARGSVEIADGNGNTITLEPAGVTIRATGRINLNATDVRLVATNLTVEAGVAKFSGAVQCDTLIANSVVSSSYTPGAGNIW